MPVEFAPRPSEPVSGRRYREPSRDPWLFWWVIAIIILTGIAVFSWVFSIYVFSYPEKPFNYELLTRLEKIDPVTRFPRLNVPGGRERTAKQIYASFYDYDDTLTNVKNSGLKRSYLWNFSEENPTYIIGEFEVTQSRTLNSDDVFPSGVVIRAKSVDYPNAFLECVFPTDPKDVPAEHFRPGDPLILEKNRSYTAILNIKWLTDDDLLITAVSLVYGRHRIDDTRFINQSPPATLNMRGHWPIMREGEPQAESETAGQDPPAEEESLIEE